MKKKMSFAHKMRLTAGWLYLVLAVYQMLLAQYHIRAMTPDQAIPAWLYSLLLIPAAAAMAIWMFASKKPLSPAARRGVLVGTFLAVLFELLTYAAQADIILFTLYYFLPSLYGNTVVVVVLAIVKLFLMIMSAFFVSNSRKVMARPMQPQDDVALEAPLIEAKPQAESATEVPATEEPADKTETEISGPEK